MVESVICRTSRRVVPNRITQFSGPSDPDPLSPEETRPEETKRQPLAASTGNKERAWSLKSSQRRSIANCEAFALDITDLANVPCRPEPCPSRNIDSETVAENAATPVAKKRPYVQHHAELWIAFKADPENSQVRNELSSKYFNWVMRLVISFYKTRSHRHPVYFDELNSTMISQRLGIFHQAVCLRLKSCRETLTSHLETLAPSLKGECS